jgi:hypothetical protein
MTTLYEQFCDACKIGNIETAKQLILESQPPYTKIDISANCEQPFHLACANKQLEMAKWLLTVKPDINISAADEYAFRIACENEDLEMAKWLLTVKPDINISINDEEILITACKNSNLELVEWLFIIKPDIDISRQNNKPFIEAVMGKFFEIIKYLLSKKPIIMKEIDNIEIFKYIFACVNNLDDIKWLYSISKISISNEKKLFDWVFKHAYLFNYPDEKIDWIMSLRPHRYVKKIDPISKCIIDYKIKTDNDENWDKRKYALWLSSHITPKKNQLLYRIPTDISRAIITYL